MPKSLRDIAVENADAKNLKTGPQNYCPTCGIPTNTGIPHGHYNVKEQTSDGTGGKQFDPKPFK
jgi:hypothetical protein